VDPDWHVDDRWSGLPRYSDPIGFGRCRPQVSRPPIHPAVEPFAAF
jgi:hypothetical protein